MKKLIYKILFVCFAIGLGVTVGMMIRNKIVADRAREAFEQMQEDTQAVSDEEENKEPVVEVTPTETPAPSETPEPTETPEPEIDALAELGIPVPDRAINWEELKSQNSDIYCWLYVPGTAVDYPVVQHPSDNNYYVDHNLDGSSGFPGCIFTQNYNTKEFDDPCTIIYGHNMRDGSMFHSLHTFADPAFFNDNPYIYIYLPSGECLVYKIFAATAFSDVHLIGQYHFTEDGDLTAYLNDLHNSRSMNANFRDEIHVTDQNHVATLSTCVGQGETQRFLVTGVLINDPLVKGADIVKMFE